MSPLFKDKCFFKNNVFDLLSGLTIFSSTLISYVKISIVWNFFSKSHLFSPIFRIPALIKSALKVQYLLVPPSGMEL